MLFIRSAFVKKFIEKGKNNSPAIRALAGFKQFLPNIFRKLFTHNMPLYATE